MSHAFDGRLADAIVRQPKLAQGVSTNAGSPDAHRSLQYESCQQNLRKAWCEWCLTAPRAGKFRVQCVEHFHCASFAYSDAGVKSPQRVVFSATYQMRGGVFFFVEKKICKKMRLSNATLNHPISRSMQPHLKTSSVGGLFPWALAKFGMFPMQNWLACVFAEACHPV